MILTKTAFERKENAQKEETRSAALNTSGCSWNIPFMRPIRRFLVLTMKFWGHDLTYMSLSKESFMESTTHWSSSFKNFDLRIKNVQVSTSTIWIFHLGVIDGKSSKVLCMQPTSLWSKDILNIICPVNTGNMKWINSNYCLTRVLLWQLPVGLVCWHWIIPRSNNPNQLCHHHLFTD